MVIREAASFIFGAVPLLRRLWHWIWERHMELELREPHSQIVRGPAGLNIPDETGPIFTVNVGEKPHIYMWCDLVITNHSENRPEVITNCELHLKIRHWLLWERTIASAPVLVDLDNKAIRPQQKAWTPIKLEPLSLPTIIPVTAQGDITYPIEKLPRKMRLVLEFDTVGRPHKRIRKLINDFTHSAS
jgi:hypothetical protein